MAHPRITRAFYDAICAFDHSESAQNLYYEVMDAKVERNGAVYSVRDQILRAYAMLFCDDIGAVAGQAAKPEDVEATADRLYVGEPSFDPKHWYRMHYHFPVIDEDNYDRFAALVVSDLSVGPLHESILKGDDMLLVGDINPLTMSSEERRHQKLRCVTADELPMEGEEA